MSQKRTTPASSGMADADFMSDFHQIPDVPLYAQLTAFMRNAIKTGRLAPGEKILSLREMSRELKVNYSSLQLATEQLMREGLLYKVHGKGMYVRDFVLRAQTVGILLSQELRLTPGDAFIHALVNLLSRKLNERGLESMVWHDNRAPEDRGTMPVYIEEAIDSNRLHALIMPNVPQESRKWVERLPLRTATSSQVLPELELRSYAGMARQMLLRRPKNPLFIMMGNDEIPFESFSMIHFLRRQGIEVRPEQVRFVDQRSLRSSSDQSYRICQEAFGGKERPDALIVWPDIAVHGAVGALLERRIKIPDELFVAFHRNRELECFCPFPATWMEISIDECADQLLRELKL